MKILAFHLLNDYSGSPKVLRMTLKGLAEKGHEINLFTSRGGVLDDLEQYGIKVHYFYYKFSDCISIAIIKICWANLLMFYYGMKYGTSKSLFFINTIMPLGGALAGWFKRAQIIYHYHENAFVKNILYRFNAECMQKLADKIICVSQFQRSYLSYENEIQVIPNALPQSMLERLKPNSRRAFDLKNILLIGSLKGYKGVCEFFHLAQILPQYKFTLVLNSEWIDIHRFIQSNKLLKPSNLCIFSRQDDLVAFYNNGSVVLNLTDSEKVLETFGLTILEAMAAGLPVIVPTKGGIVELVEDGVNGYRIDSKCLVQIAGKIHDMLSNYDLYNSLSMACLQKSKFYYEKEVTGQINDLIISSF